MHNHKIASANKQIKFITYIGILCNIILSAVKVGAGLAVASIALIADGVHSLSDMATDIAVLLGVHFGSKQPDEEHPYGHGRIETFAAVFIALILTVGGSAMIYYAAWDIALGNIKTARFAILVVAVISIVTKELLYRATKKIAVKSNSSALYANAWHHRSDALSSIAVLIGFIAMRFGFGYGDQIAAIAVGLMVILVGMRVAGECLRELTESAVDSETVAHIKEIINSDSSIHRWHKLRTRMVGREVFLDLHILLDPQLNITAAHEIAESLEHTMDEKITRPVNITVHVEPDVPELRK
ncbi:MAG: cation diffusion facilitator family transporter [Planctomycetota bacterium]|jgi:cation diffusion facilitator family transporter